MRLQTRKPRWRCIFRAVAPGAPRVWMRKSEIEPRRHGEHGGRPRLQEWHGVPFFSLL